MYEYPRNAVPVNSGYRITFHLDERNICPGCSQSNWHVGRMTAECAFCATTLPLEGGGGFGTGLFTTRGRTELVPELVN